MGLNLVDLITSQLGGGTVSKLAGALGLSAALCAVWALCRSSGAARALGVLGALALTAGILHASLFVHYMQRPEPAPLLVPAVQKVSALLLSAWMLGVAGLTLSRRRESDP